jgi:hypothetical protein
MEIPEKFSGPDNAQAKNNPRPPEDIIGRLEQFTTRIFHELADGTVSEEETKRRLVLLARNTFNDVDPKLVQAMSADARSAVEKALESNPVNVDESKYAKADFVAEMFVTAMKRHLERYLFQSYSKNMYSDPSFGNREAESALQHYNHVASTDPYPTRIYKREDLDRNKKNPGGEKE